MQAADSPPEAAAAPLDGVILPPIEEARASFSRRLFAFAGVLLSAVVVFAAAWAYADLNFAVMEALIPSSPLFWAVFVISYLQGPFLEWVIFRRLWHIPFLSGMSALLRKLVTNELVLGYLGEAQFYAWTRARANITSAPFGAIKDVAILSALAGNAATLVMLVFAWPIVSSGLGGVQMRSVFLSLGVVLITSCAILLFRKKLFSLSRRELWFITGVHIARIVLFIAFSAFLWHLILPQAPIGLWMVLATLRMLVSRLPLLPNKDIVFAGIAVFLLGHDLEVAALMTLWAALGLASHVVAGVISGVAGLVETRFAGTARSVG